MTRLANFIDHTIPHRDINKQNGNAFAPSNIALVKYWGKRDSELNLPLTSSLSVSLDDLGTHTSIEMAGQDEVILNGEILAADHSFTQRLTQYLDLFRPQNTFFKVDTKNNIPTAAGLASSASGFAALTKALDQLFDWKLDTRRLSLLARVGSGSACRSLETGFVKWHGGEQADGLDSYAEALPQQWLDLRVGLLMVDASQKPMSSREAMIKTRETAKRYQQWPERVATDLPKLEQAIIDNNFERLGQIAENNALEMHACMEDAQPPISFSTEETVNLRKAIWKMRAAGIKVYFTQDAGPNLKCLFLQQDQAQLIELLGDFKTIEPFKSQSNNLPR